MPKKISDIRSIVERDINDVLDNDSVLIWCNDANMDFGTVLNVPGTTAQIALDTTSTSYALPSDLKEINRLWLQSEYDNGLNRGITVPYRIYAGNIEFPIPFPFTDTLNIDYYKFLTTFDDIDDLIDFPDRYMTIYTSYCATRYFSLPSTQDRLGELPARRNYERTLNAYTIAKRQVIQNYSFNNPDLSVKERW